MPSCMEIANPNSLESMPLDVLEVIYNYIFLPPSNPDYDSRSGSGRISCFPGSYLTPLPLCHVSSRLRQTALQISAIWSSIYIYNISPNQIHLLRFWLNNASTRPLSIAITIYKPKGWLFHWLLFPKLSEILGNKSPQWRSLSLRLPNYASDIFLNLRPEDLPSLESVELRLERWESEHRDRLFNVLASAPSLHRLDWSATFGPNLPGSVPWERLTDLTLERPRTLMEVALILEKAQNLCSLKLGDLSNYPTLAHQYISVNAQTLTVTAPRMVDALFPILIFPRLSELFIDIIDQRLSSNGWEILRSMAFDGTQTSLRRFSYSSSLGDPDPKTQDHFMNLFISPRMNQLVHLVLHLNITDILIHFLTHHTSFNNGAGFYTLPHLEVLSLSRCKVKSDGLISTMVLSRFSTRSPSRGLLKHVDISVDGPGEFLKDKSAFEDLRRGGIEAHLLVW